MVYLNPPLAVQLKYHCCQQVHSSVQCTQTENGTTCVCVVQVTRGSLDVAYLTLAFVKSSISTFNISVQPRVTLEKSVHR